MSHTETMEASAPNYALQFLRNMAEMWKEYCFCDITIFIGTREFQAHKTVLAAASPFFKAMLLSGMEEQRRNEIELHDISPVVFERIITFIYSGNICVDTSTCQDLLAVADMFGMQDVVDICSQFLLDNIDPQNCVGIYEFASARSLMHLKYKAELYLEKHFLHVCQEEEFNQLELPTVATILSSERLHIEHESQVLEAAVSWVLADLPKRRKCLLQVLQQVRFRLISHKHLFLVVDSCCDLGVKTTLKKFASSPDSVRDLNPNGLYVAIPSLNSTAQPRLSAKKYIYVVGGFSRNKTSFVSSINTLDSIERYDIDSGKWQNFKGMCHPRSSHGIAVLDRKIVVAGGEDASLISDSVECFDPDENYWTPLPSMKHPRYGLGLVTLYGCLYAFGGYVGTEVGASVEKYDEKTRTWTVIDKMPNPRFAMAIVEHEGLIYTVVVGGLTEMYTESDKMESYNPVTKEWCSLAKLNVPRAYHGLVVLDGCLYAAGGFNEFTGSLRTVEKYSIKDDVWKTVSPMDMSRAGAAIAVTGGKIYVFGGRSQDVEMSGASGFCASVTLKTVECYDSKLNQWTYLPQMSHERCETMAVVL